jgi:dipeptidyl aminopeptidase/acylaminoacyl peptidase
MRRKTPRRLKIVRAGLAALLIAVAPSAAAAGEGIGPADLDLIEDVAEPDFSPDGEDLVYTVGVVNRDTDRRQSDLWRVRYATGERTRLTWTPDHSEWQPRHAPDGRAIAFLSDRGGEEAATQVWLLPAAGGEARVLTDFPGGVQDFAWSPDGRRLAVIAQDPERPAGEEQPRQPPPLVIDRYYFKEDVTGYLGRRRQHLYVFDLGTGKAELLTPGEHDEYLPAWSPDGSRIAYVTKRGEDPDRHFNFDLYVIEPRAGAVERPLTRFEGADLSPDWLTHPAWSPDGTQIAYLQGGEDRWLYYATYQLAVVDVGSGATRLPAPIDRPFSRVRWAPDGRSVYALIEESRVTRLSRIDLASGRVTPLTHGARFDVDFALCGKRIAVLGGDDHRRPGLFAVEPRGLRPLGDHNAWLGERRLAPVEGFSFRSADGTEVDGLLVKPLDYVPGRRYPAILRLHGGPVYQFSHEFMADWQAYAARGYVVIAPNPRGSSGRGFDFARAIYADWGNKDVEDVLAAVDHVVAAGIADPGRLGVGGRSYGGMLTNYVIASDGRFKAAVSGAGASNFLGLYGHDMYVREYDLELGPPWEKRELWERLSYPFLQAGRISTPTLFYCTEKDFNMPCLGSEQMYQALRTRGVPTQLVIYPGEYHTLAVPSYLRDRLERLIGWYDRYLKK